MTTFRTSSGARCKRKPFIKHHWTREEDELLTLLVHMHGPAKWDRIAAHIHGRTGKSCRIRWMNQLNPRVDKKPFSAQEKQRLLELHREYGNRWSTIASSFPGRTDNQVKNQYHILAGTRCMKASASSSPTDPHGPLEERSTGLSRYQSISTVPNDSPFSDVSVRETNYYGFAPYSMRPSLICGSSSVYGQGETFTRVAAHSSILSSLVSDSSDGDSIYPHQRISRGNSMISDANSAEVEELCPVPQPQRGVGIRDYQFIDFFGVGSSE